jgi:hypothetical protein
LQVLGEVVLKEDMLGQLDGGWDVIRESLGAEWRGELRETKAAVDADLNDALDAIDEDAAAFHEDVASQLTELAKQRTEDIGLLQRVAGEMVRRSGSTSEEIAGLQGQLDEMLEGVVEELSHTTRRTQAIEARLDGPIRGDITRLYGLMEETSGRVGAAEAASEERIAQMMEVLEQEVEAREAGVERLAGNLGELSDKVDSEVDGLRADLEAVVVRLVPCRVASYFSRLFYLRLSRLIAWSRITVVDESCM